MVDQSGQSAYDAANTANTLGASSGTGIIDALSKIGGGLAKGLSGAGSILGGTPAPQTLIMPKAPVNNGALPPPQAAPVNNTFSDAHLQEPGGPAAWTLREEPNFILAKNDRTGDMQKVKTEPLSPQDKKQAEAPHGAGPIYSDMCLGGYYKDMKLNNDSDNTMSNFTNAMRTKEQNEFANSIISALDKKFSTKGKK
jgi:hypothetical protein